MAPIGLVLLPSQAMGATYVNFGTGTFHVDGDDPLTQDQVDEVWYRLPTTGAGWVEKGHYFVQQYDGAKVFDLGPVAAGVKDVSDKTQQSGYTHGHKRQHATKKKAVKARRVHAKKKSPVQLQREIDAVLAHPKGADEDAMEECAACGVRIPFADTYSPGDMAICADCDTEATGRRHSKSEYGKVTAARRAQGFGKRTSHATAWAERPGEVTSTAGLMQIASAVARELKRSGMTWGDTSRARGRSVRIWSSGTSVRFEVPGRFAGQPSDSQAIVELHLVGPDRSNTSVGPFAGDMHYDKRFGEAMDQRVQQVLKKGVR